MKARYCNFVMSDIGEHTSHPFAPWWFSFRTTPADLKALRHEVSFYASGFVEVRDLDALFETGLQSWDK